MKPSRETIGERSITHGMSNTAIYRAWCNMKARCCNPNNREFYLYGGRGIKVCDRWLNSFENFYEDMGDCPSGMELDRKRNNEGYSKDNCHWTTAIRNCRNRRSTRFITFRGETLSVEDWADRTGIKGKIIRQRIDRQGWDLDRALQS